MKLTKRQKEILDFVRKFIDREGYSPSMEEIAGHFQFASLNSVFKHLGSLETRGYLRRDPNRARSIELSRREEDATRILPLFGYVAAGRPIEAVVNEENVAIPAEFLPGRGSYYVLRVKGESMIGDHIEDGDFVVVESRKDATPGEMIVALVDGENVTLKRLYQEGNQIRLQPANPELQPIILDAGRVQVQGVVVGLLRRYH
jgi:repressor LexA